MRKANFGEFCNHTTPPIIPIATKAAPIFKTLGVVVDCLAALRAWLRAGDWGLGGSGSIGVWDFIVSTWAATASGITVVPG